MPRIFWTLTKKDEILELAKHLSLLQLAAYYRKPLEEVTRVLKQISPDYSMVKDVRYEGKIKVTICHPAFAEGINPQISYSNHLLY